MNGIRHKFYFFAGGVAQKYTVSGSAHSKWLCTFRQQAVGQIGIGRIHCGLLSSSTCCNSGGSPAPASQNAASLNMSESQPLVADLVISGATVVSDTAAFKASVAVSN